MEAGVSDEDVQEGSRVVTWTMDRRRVVCRVIRDLGDGHLLLDSPAHGHALIRRRDEVDPHGREGER
jgi:hypothetical protein